MPADIPNSSGHNNFPGDAHAQTVGTAGPEGQGAIDLAGMFNNTSAQESPQPASGEPEFMILKYTFGTLKRGEMAGAFSMIFEGPTGKITMQNFWVTHNSDKLSLKADLGWRSFNKQIPQIGTYDKMWGDKLNAMLPYMISDDERAAIFLEESESRQKGLLIKIEDNVRNAFERATHSFFECTCGAEKITREQLEELGIIKSENAAAEEAPKEEEEEDKSFEGTIIQCIPILDPVWGKAASQLFPGDKVEVELNGVSGASGLVRKFLETTNQQPIFPVEEITRREDKTYIRLRISDEIIGLVTLTKDIRIKATQAAQTNKSKTPPEDIIFFAILAVGLIGLFFALSFLFS